jgi:hypothetical protein
MTEDERQKRYEEMVDRLLIAWDRTPEPTRSRLEAILDGVKGKTLQEREQWLRSELSALWTEMAPTAVGLYGVLSSYINRQTGMTVEDYVWLRDYERRVSGTDQGPE